MFEQATLDDLPAFRCGNAQNEADGCGCTVVVAPAGAVCGVDVRGGGPATRETDLLRPENMIESVHAVVLAGGSAFGLEASTGVAQTLAERGIGFRLGEACVPIVVGACLFDLLVGNPAHPDAAMGRQAALAAFDDAEACAEGNVGAGCGATVGKLLDAERAMKSGLGIYGLRAGDLVAVAIVAVNALGNVCDAQGRWIAGCRDDAGCVMDPLDAFDALSRMPESETSAAPCTNTTIGVVLTNARITKAQATKTASTVHDAYARAIKPVHTLNDGDTVFAFASGEVACQPDAATVLATEAMQRAIERAVTCTTGAYGLPAAADLPVPPASLSDR